MSNEVQSLRKTPHNNRIHPDYTRKLRLCYTEASATGKPAASATQTEPPNSAACSYLYVVAIWSAPARPESAARVGELGASRGSREAAVSKHTTAGLTRGFFN